MDDINYDALIALLPEKYRAAVLAALQLVGVALTVLSVLVPAIEKVVKATPSKTDDAYFSKLARVRNVLSMFPRVIVPRLSSAPTQPAPAAVMEAATKLNVSWPDAQTVAEATKASASLAPSGDK